MTAMQKVKGTRLQVGQTLCFPVPQVIVRVVPGQHAAGARYADVTTADGTTRRCWEGFRHCITREVEAMP